jgi:hypothetical protein
MAAPSSPRPLVQPSQQGSGMLTTASADEMMNNAAFRRVCIASVAVKA